MQLVSIGTLHILKQLLLVVGYDSLDMVPSMDQCVCAHKQDCGSADVGGVHVVSASLDLHAYMCTCMPWCVPVCPCVTFTLAMPSSRCVCCRSEDSFFLWDFASRGLVVYVGLPT